MSKATDNPLTLRKKHDETEADALGRFAITPTVQGAMTLQHYRPASFEDVPLDSLVESLEAQTEAANFTRVESMLTTQAHTLDAVFNNLARRSARRETVDSMAVYLKLALKAQSQCRSTLEALAEIKAPRSATFVKQANYANGHQQVNNGTGPGDAGAPSGGTRARKKPKTAKQTKQVQHHAQQTLDTPSQGQTSGTDSTMAAVEAIDGTANGKR